MEHNSAKEELTVGTISASPGVKEEGYLKVAEGTDNPLELPIITINGSEPGDTLCLAAGVHGAEYPGIEVILGACASINPLELDSSIMAIPTVNTPAFEEKSTHICPIDGLNLNRVFPGKPDG